MKKVIAAIAIISTIATAGTALAYKGMRNNGQGYNPDCPMINHGAQVPVARMDEAVRGKIASFFSDNAGLRKQMQIKHAEMKALMRSANPDSKQAGALAGEIFDLRYTLKQKAIEAGLSEYLPMMGCGLAGQRMRGHGMHHGMRHGMGRGTGYNCPTL